jgi:tRNA nucleotidyltransferase (CCA-adding enzyme)
VQSPRKVYYEHFPHGADVGVRGFGDSREEAFEQAALAMTAVVTEPGNVTAAEGVDIECEAPDGELLLTDWLNALVYEMATRDMLFGRFEVRIEDGRLHGRAWGEKLDVARHDPIVEVKGATLTNLRVAQEADGSWVAQCVIDV